MFKALLVFAIIGFMGWYGKKYTPAYTDEKEIEEEKDSV